MKKAGPILRASMQASRARYWRPVERLARNPRAAQEKVLMDLIAANRDTQFGLDHQFAKVRDPETYRELVPVQDYEKLRPYIDEQRTTGVTALTAETPLFYSQTSGSTGKPKYIPITSSTLGIHRTEQALFSFLQYRACPDAFIGKGLGIMGAAVEGRLDTGQLVGSVSGRLYESMPKAVKSKFVLPAAVARIADYDLKYLVIARLALAVSDITYLGSPNPSTFLRLLDLINDQRDILLDSVATGKFGPLAALEPAIREEIAPRLKADNARAARLRRLGHLTFANTWPDIRLITTWTGGSCGIALAKLRKHLPPGIKVMEMGYRSTEFCGTIALEADTSSGIPPLHHHFFEFVEQSRWDRGDPRFLTLNELEPGSRYYVLISTASGLYRYFMNDLVEVTSRFERTPLLRFLQKGSGVTSMTGEKLYEAQVIDAVQHAASRHGFSAHFFLLIAEEDASAYRLFVEVDQTPSQTDYIATGVDQRLGELNIEYHSKRASGRLGPLAISWLRSGAAEAYKAAALRAGQREGQFKPAILQYRKNLVLSFDEYLLP